MKDTWVQVAGALARRLARHATCQQHDSVRAGAAHGCPACADITALRRFERHYLRARGTPFVLAQTAAAAADYDVPLPLDDQQGTLTSVDRIASTKRYSPMQLGLAHHD